MLIRKDEPCDCGRIGVTRGKCCHGGGGGGLIEDDDDSKKDIRGGIQRINVGVADNNDHSNSSTMIKRKKRKRSRGGILWNSLHPDGYECDKCPSCLTLLCMPKLMQLW